MLTLLVFVDAVMILLQVTVVGYGPAEARAASMLRRGNESLARSVKSRLLFPPPYASTPGRVSCTPENVGPTVVVTVVEEV